MSLTISRLAAWRCSGVTVAGMAKGLLLRRTQEFFSVYHPFPLLSRCAGLPFTVRPWSYDLTTKGKTHGNLSTKYWRAVSGDEAAPGLRCHCSAAQQCCHSHPWGHTSWLQRLDSPRQQPRTGGWWVDTNHQLHRHRSAPARFCHRDEAAPAYRTWFHLGTHPAGHLWPHLHRHRAYPSRPGARLPTKSVERANHSRSHSYPLWSASVHLADCGLLRAGTARCGARKARLVLVFGCHWSAGRRLLC